jgi:hypothetical protein
MSFSINTRDLPSIHTYEQADKWFTEAHYPARSKKWFSYQRPLRNTRSHHLRIEKRDVDGVDCYDLVLYQTPVIRLFKPNEQGEHAVWLQTYYSVSTVAFMWTMGWYDRMDMQDTNGNKIKVPVSPQSRAALSAWGDTFTTKLVLDSEGRVITDKSAHIPYMRKSSTATHRAKRKQLREDLSVIYDLLEMQYQSFVSGMEVLQREGAPFEARANRTRLDGKVAEKIREDGIRSLDANDTTHLMQFANNTCKDIAQSIVNRRAYAFEFPKFDFSPYEQGDWDLRSKGWDIRQERDNGMRVRGEAPHDGKPVSFHTPELQAYLMPTWDDIKKAIDLEFQSLAQLKSGDTYKPYPQFMADLPRKVWCIETPSGWNNADIRDLVDEDTYCKLVNRKGVVY